MYADDTTLFTGSRYASNIQVNLAKDIRKLEDWFKLNHLKLNGLKTEYMLIANNHIRKHYQHIKLKVGGIVLQEKEKIKILGVTISNNLSWEAHTSNLIRNVKYCYRSFSRS